MNHNIFQQIGRDTNLNILTSTEYIKLQARKTKHNTPQLTTNPKHKSRDIYQTIQHHQS